MITLPIEYKNRHVAVFGLRRTGLSTIQSLVSSGAIAYPWDDNTEALEEAKELFNGLSSNVIFIHPNSYDWEKIKLLILSPGIPLTFPEPHWIVKAAQESRNVSIGVDVGLFIETCNKMLPRPKIIGVTGTNGKSTTTSLIAHILNSNGISAEVGGNIGIPALSLTPSKQAYVLEISSFQMDLIENKNTREYSMDASVLLNITPDHLDRHGNMENYIRAKVKLLQKSKIVVIGVDSEESQNVYQKFTFPNASAVIPTSKKEANNANFKLCPEDETFKLYEDSKFVASVEQEALKINLGVNAENIVATYALIRKTFDLGPHDILSAIKSFIGLPHRCEYLGKAGNLVFVNDSKSTNADSSENTILSYSNIYWIVGGVQKKEGISPFLKNPKEKLKNVLKIFLIGECSEEFANNLDASGWIEYEKCENLANAFEQCISQGINSGMDNITVLLSPICASFDQFNNFEHRGEVFRKLVEDYLANRPIFNV